MPITRMSVQVEEDNFPKLAARMTSDVNRIVSDNTKTFVRLVQQRAPLGKRAFFDSSGHKHPGRLKSSVNRTKLGAGHWLVKVDAPYGIYVDKGTRHMRGRFFWNKSVQELRRLLQSDLRTVFRRGNR